MILGVSQGHWEEPCNENKSLPSKKGNCGLLGICWIVGTLHNAFVYFPIQQYHEGNPGVSPLHGEIEDQGHDLNTWAHIQEQESALWDLHSSMEPCWLSLIVDGTPSLGIGSRNPWNVKKPCKTKDMRTQHVVNWQVRARNCKFVLKQGNLERPGLCVGLRSRWTLGRRKGVSFTGDKHRCAHGTIRLFDYKKLMKEAWGYTSIGLTFWGI